MPRPAKTNPRIGSDFEDFLREQGRLAEATALAIKRVLAWEFSEAMRKTDVSQAEMARRMGTSRAVVRRLLDESDPSVTLTTISRAPCPRRELQAERHLPSRRMALTCSHE